jgi:hypothetical protein
VKKSFAGNKTEADMNHKGSVILTLFLLGLFSYSVIAQTGNITYTLHRENNPTQTQQNAYAKIQVAMDSALGYYNKYTSITKFLNVYYNPDVSTADANFNGTIRFGKENYMVVHTAMHEIAHTVGVGTTNEYRNLMQNGVFTGAYATTMIREVTGDQNAVVNGDNQHFWPYGLNYANEVKSSQDLINHCKIVGAMYSDMFREEFFRTCRLKSRLDGRCMTVLTDNSLRLGDCNSSASVVRMISLNGENVFRLEFGNKVLDIPNESTSAGIVVGLYNWNGGGHQRVIFEFEQDTNLARLKMQHSGLYLRADGDRIIQDRGTVSPESQYWELVDDQVKSVYSVQNRHRITEGIRVINGLITVNSSVLEGKTVKLKITDLHGRVIRSVLLSGDAVISTAGFIPGVYIINLYGNGKNFTSRFMVR